MKKKKLTGMLLTLVCALSLLTGCGQSSAGTQVASDTAAGDTEAGDTGAESTEGNESNEVSDHEPLSICNPFRDVNAFIDVVHKYYPEINFEVLPYAGSNSTAYMQGQLRSGELPDIYTTSVYSPGQFDSADKLLDLSQYAFTDNYVQARLREAASEDGAIYMLPNYFQAIGITYNKKILEENGWELPTSLKEMEALAPKVREAGYTLCLDQIQFPGFGFQYMCNILDTGFFSTMDGLRWQNKFLNGEATIADTPEMLENMQMLQRWRDIGLLNNEQSFSSDADVAAEMAKGNTLFMLGSTNDFTSYGADSDDFGLMPYLSEDGDQNIFMLSVIRYTGLNKKLAEPGNEEKLEDALHVMEILSTEEGMEALNSAVSKTALTPLKDAQAVKGTYYSEEVLEQINAGYTAPFVYAGWENTLADDGNKMLDFIRGEADLDELIATVDDNQKLIADNSDQLVTTVTETISTEDCARLVGTVFAKESGADLALVSMDKWFPETHDDGNRDGVSGCLFALPVTNLEITSILPTGWNGNIETYTLTGKRIKELAETGYDYKDQGLYYPYQLVTKEGFEIKDDATYTVAICGATDEVREEGSVQDTGILGLTAMEEYLGQFDTFSAADIRWE